MITVTLSSKGEVVIPKALRQRAGLQPGMRFSVQLIDGEIRLRLISNLPSVVLDELAGCLARAQADRLPDAKGRRAMLARFKARPAAPSGCASR